jgi:putative FmdB family regulatory protein
VPLYEYVCRKCSRQFEELIRGTREGTTVARCPACDTTDVRRILSVVSVGHADATAAAPGPAPCGSCGDPRGPGSCAFD